MNTEETKKALMEKSVYTYDDLKAIMKILRGKDGCPWDMEQTHKSIRNNLLEEAYEVVEGIDSNDSHIMREELGDLLLQIVFHCAIAEEENEFTDTEVISEICQKLIVRHPHIFADTKVSGTNDVLTNWDKIKYETKGLKSAVEIMGGVSVALPSLVRAQKLHKRSEKLVGEEKARETIGKISFNDDERVSGEIGRRLFEIAAEARKAGVDAEEALEVFNKAFLKANTEIDKK